MGHRRHLRMAQSQGGVGRGSVRRGWAVLGSAGATECLTGSRTCVRCATPSGVVLRGGALTRHEGFR